MLQSKNHENRFEIFILWFWISENLPTRKKLYFSLHSNIYQFTFKVRNRLGDSFEKKIVFRCQWKNARLLDHKFLSQTKILHLSPPNSHTHCFIQTHTTINQNLVKNTQCRSWDLNSKLKYHLLEPKITIKQCDQIMTLREICSWITTPSRY